MPEILRGRRGIAGVSEVIGYIFIFSIIMASVAFAYVNVNNLVKDTTDKYRVEGLRESFRRIQNVFFLSTYGGSPVQSIQVEFQGGRLYIANQTRVQIYLNSTPVFDGYVKSLNYRYGNYIVTVENGAVWENYYGYRRTVMNPRVFVQRVEVQGVSGAYQTVVMIVISALKGNLSTSGQGSTNLIFNSSVREVVFNNTPGVLTMRVTSDYAENWCKFFSELTGDYSPLGCPEGITTTEMQIFYDVVIIAVYDTAVETRPI